MKQREQLLADLKLLVTMIPEEKQDEDSYYASNRIYNFIEYHTGDEDYEPAEWEKGE